MQYFRLAQIPAFRWFALAVAVMLVFRTTSVSADYTFDSLYSFDLVNGQLPSGLLLDAQGNLYGTTSFNGVDGSGSLFELSEPNNVYTDLNNWIPVSTNAPIEPSSPYFMDSSGDLYGTTGSGGSAGLGSVYEFVAGTRQVTTVASLTSSVVGNGLNGVFRDSSGNLFGTTFQGGADHYGAIVELAAGSTTFTNLFSFNGANGNSPNGGLIADKQGNLYGTTYFGGANNMGSVFEYSPSTNTFTTLHSFASPTVDGAYPRGSGLVADADGNMYGEAYSFSGGNGAYGTLFKISATTHQFTVIAYFNGTDGAGPNGTLSIDAKGDLFGDTYGGGTYNFGTVFELPAGSNTPIDLYSFSGPDGRTPMSQLVLDAGGDIFGTTYYGGKSLTKTNPGDGTVFELAYSPLPNPAVGGAFLLACVAFIFYRQSRRRQID